MMVCWFLAWKFIWLSWNHVYEFDSISYYTSSLIIAESCFLFILSSFCFLKLPCVCQVLWSDQQSGCDHCDPVWGPGVGGDGEARGPGAGQGQPSQVHHRQQDLLLHHRWGTGAWWFNTYIETCWAAKHK